jgi:K+-sensing histidine kinase KdpD
LGLSVVKAIIESCDGQVGVDDRPDGGSIFWFALPVLKDRNEGTKIKIPPSWEGGILSQLTLKA